MGFRTQSCSPGTGQESDEINKCLPDSQCRPCTSDDTALGLQDDRIWEPFGEFMSRSRINVSVRQVTGPGFDFPVETMATDDETSMDNMSNCLGLRKDGDFSGVKRKAENLHQ